ncbi:MAG: chlorophyll synthase ChlG [Pseudomonadota bacterium]
MTAARLFSTGDRPDFSAVLTLLKPVTWFAPMWAFLCGAISSGAALADRWDLVLLGMLLAGPLVCGMSQAVNDWFDRHVDALNEPHRPIPSGRIPGRWGLWIGILWTIACFAVAAPLGPWVLGATVVAAVLAWAYSAPPLRLKRDGWIGGAACAFSYEGIAWFTGAAALLAAAPEPRIIALAVLYSLGAHGIMTLNDFKSVDGDRRSGVRSLPARMGPDAAARVACVAMAAPQLVVVALLWIWGAPIAAGIVAALLAGQAWLMRRYLLDRSRLAAEPLRSAALYNATGTSLYVLGMMASAIALRGLA